MPFVLIEGNDHNMSNNTDASVWAPSIDSLLVLASHTLHRDFSLARGMYRRALDNCLSAAVFANFNRADCPLLVIRQRRHLAYVP